MAKVIVIVMTCDENKELLESFTVESTDTSSIQLGSVIADAVAHADSVFEVEDFDDFSDLYK